MDNEELIRQLQNENDQFRREIELLKGHIAYLEARLAQYENAHTPPSKKRGGNRKKDYDEGGCHWRSKNAQ